MLKETAVVNALQYALQSALISDEERKLLRQAMAEAVDAERKALEIIQPGLHAEIQPAVWFPDRL
jgi:hypothetical protein